MLWIILLVIVPTFILLGTILVCSIIRTSKSLGKKNKVKEKMPRQKKKGVIGRVLKELFKAYPRLLPITIIFIVINAIVSSIPSVFMQKVISIMETSYKAGDWNSVSSSVIELVIILAVLYIISLIAGIVYNQLLAIITQGFLKKMRAKMFDHMQTLPIKYFDTHSHGDIMSYYTNDIDTLRQLISQSIPQLLISGIIVISVLFIMLYYSFILTLVVIVGVILILIATKIIGGRSARYFIAQQKAIAQTEGYVEEIMNGQKVVKVFNHEEKTIEEFNKINEVLFEESNKANTFANMLMPVLHNIGNILYVIVAFVGGVLLINNVANPSFSHMTMGISIVIPFLNMTKQFTGNISQVSGQVNSVVMGMAGARRIFDLLDEEPEVDNGYVTLVNAKMENGEIVETEERTGMWAWRHPHQDGTVTYTKLLGDVQMYDVDFGYEENKIVLHDVTLYANPGQKIAFVGATGAGKTTITNLINRFYDIADGKIRYDGININKIKKADLRHSLGIVLQDTNLFTGTVLDNIRYGKLDATDQECIDAAILAGADEFINKMADGYNTYLTNNGSNLSQGQRQLIAIARAAVANPPVMILDEATSSIDTRTETIVQKGMDALMKGRTVFVIAHRLSTIRNADVIMVLDHGRIIERGTHQQLLENKGEYYQLYTGAFELE